VVRGERDRLKQSFLRGNRYAMWLTIAIAYPLVVFAGPVIQRYAGARFSLAADVMLLSLISVPIRYANSMTARLAHATARVRPFGMRLVSSQVLNVGLTIWFVGGLGWGALGSIAATLVASIVQLIQAIPLGLEMSGAKLPEWVKQTFVPGLIPGLASALLLWCLGEWVEPSSWLRLGATTAITLPLYAALVWVVAAADERQDALRAVAEVSARVRAKLGA
jgi:hypothetical protein